MLKKSIIATIVVISVLVGFSEAWATRSRMEAMGNQGVYLSDDTNVFDNPSRLAYSRDCVFLHLSGIGGPNDTSVTGAISLAIGDKITLGFIAGSSGGLVLGTEKDIFAIKMDALQYQILPSPPFPPQTLVFPPVPTAFRDPFGVYPGGPPPPNEMKIDIMNPFGVILTYQFDKVAIGAGYMLMNGQYKWEDKFWQNERTESATLHALQAGFAAKLGKWSPEAYIQYYPYSMKSNYKDELAFFESKQELKGALFEIGARAFYEYSDKLTITPAIMFRHTTGEVMIKSEPHTILNLGMVGVFLDEEDMNQSYRVDRLNTGVGMQYHTGGFFGLTVAWSIGVDYFRFKKQLGIDKIDYDESLIKKDYASPKLAIGIEYWVNQLYCLRAGVSTTTLWATHAETNKLTDTTGGIGKEDNTNLYTTQSTQAAVGIGFRFWKLLVDGTFGSWFLANEQGAGNPIMPGSGPNLFANLDIKVKW